MDYFWDGYLNGSAELNINVTVNGETSTLQLMMNDTLPSLLIASGKCFLKASNNKILHCTEYWKPYN